MIEFEHIAYIKLMEKKINLKESYILAKCCMPALGDKISGYFSHDNFLKVHKNECANLAKVEPERMVMLKWDEILQAESFTPDNDYSDLDETDFAVLNHHLNLGIDYSLMLAKSLSIDKQSAFDIHSKLKEMKLIKRVESLMVQYRKGVVDNKWIKHRNHTYYDLTPKGQKYTKYYNANREAK